MVKRFSWLCRVAAIAFLFVTPTLLHSAEGAKTDSPKCAIIFPTEYSVTVSDYQGACGPVRTLWLRRKDGGTAKDLAQFSFWKDDEAPGGIPLITTDTSGVFHVDLLLSDFEAIHGIIKTEKVAMVVFECDGSGGYQGVHVTGGNEEAELRGVSDKLLALERVQESGKRREIAVPQDTAPFRVSTRQVVRVTGEGISGSSMVAEVDGPAKVVSENQILTFKDGHILVGMMMVEYEIKPTGQGTVKVKITCTPPQPDSQPTVKSYEFEVSEIR